jgi:hypothetical protein
MFAHLCKGISKEHFSWDEENINPKDAKTNLGVLPKREPRIRYYSMDQSKEFMVSCITQNFPKTRYLTLKSNPYL